MEYNGFVYDPSYGIEPLNSLQEWEDQVIEGFGIYGYYDKNSDPYSVPNDNIMFNYHYSFDSFYFFMNSIKKNGVSECEYVTFYN